VRDAAVLRHRGRHPEKSRPTTAATGYPEPATAASAEPAPLAVSRRRIWAWTRLDFCLTPYWDWVRTTFAEQDHSHEPSDAANEPVTQPLTPVTNHPELAAPDGEEGADVDAEAGVDAEAEVDAEADVDAEAEDDGEEEAEGEEDTDGDGDAEVDGDAEPDPEPEADGDGDAEPEPEAEAEGDTEPDPEPDADGDAETEPDPEPEDSDASPDAGADELRNEDADGPWRIAGVT
jgi:hypothetical protein